MATKTAPKAPNKAYITAIATWAGGSLAQLPYAVSMRGQTIDAQGHVTFSYLGPSLSVSGDGGFWSGYYSHAAWDIAFHKREIEMAVMGHPDAPSFPNNWRILVPPTCPMKCQQANDQINVGDPLITVEAPTNFRSTDKRREAENKIAKYIMGRLQQEERDSDTSPLLEQRDLTSNYGLGARMVTIDPERYPEMPRREEGEGRPAYRKRMGEWNKARRGKSPFVTRTMHPLAIAYDRSHNPPEWMLLREPIAPWEAAAKYPHLKIMDDKPSTSAPPAVEAHFWTQGSLGDWYWCGVNGEDALTSEDGADEHGVVSNSVEDGGYGCIPVWPSAGAHGEPDPAGRPEVELAGIIRANRDALLLDAVLTNIELVYARRAGYGPKQILQGPGDVDDPIKVKIAAQIMGGPEKVVVMPDSTVGYTVSPIDMADLPPSVEALHNRVLAALDESMSYSIAAGNPAPAVSGVRANLSQQQLSKRVETVTLHLEQTIEASFMAELRWIRDVLKEPVSAVYTPKGQPAESADLKPEDIPDGLVVKCSLMTDTEQDKARKLEQGLTLVAPQADGMPLIDKETFYRDYMQARDPKAIGAGLVADAVFQQVTMPRLLQIAQGKADEIVAKVAAKYGLTWSQEELAAASQREQQAKQQAAMQEAMANGSAVDPNTGQPGVPVDAAAGAGGAGGPVGVAGTPLPEDPGVNPEQQTDGGLGPDQVDLMLRQDRRDSGMTQTLPERRLNVRFQ